MTRRVLVTGSTGFVGGAVSAALTARGCSVVGVARSALQPLAARSTTSFVAIDLSADDAADRLSAAAADGPFDAVVHVAGLAHRRASADEFAAHNVAATATVARWAAAGGAGRLVLVSSVAVYGPRDDRAEPADEHATPAPVTPYGHSKLAAEAAAAVALAASAVSLAILRLTTVFGPGDPGNVSALARAVERGRLPRVGHGRNRKSLIAVDDAAAIIAEVALAEPTIAGTFNVATGRHELREIVAAMAVAAGRRAPRRWLPLPGQSWIVRRLGAAELAEGRVATVLRRLRPLRIWLSDDAVSGDALAGLLGVRFPAPRDLTSALRAARGHGG